MQPNSVLIIPLAGISLPLILVPLILAFRHSAKKREYEHRERMKALETGQTVPGGSNWPAACVCMAIGAGVPIASFLIVTWVVMDGGHAVSNWIWCAPAIVSVVAFMSVDNLGRTLLSARGTGHPASSAHLNGKPAFDPDAYDVAGSRG